MKRGRLHRHTPLRRRNRPRYPERRDPAYMEWLKVQLICGVPCDACGTACATDRAHLEAKGSGGYDRLNVVLLCRRCHERQEKRTDLFCQETGVDLWYRAAQWDNLFVFESGRPRP